MAARVDSWRARSWLGVQLALLVSLAAHALVYALLRWAGTMPKVDFELKLPNEVQFGLAEPTPPPTTPTEPPASAAAASSAVAAAKPKPPKPKHRTPLDAGPPDAGARSSVDPGKPSTPGNDGGAPLLSAYAPAGAQLALRLHMGRVRESSLADDVRVLLDAIPDWRLIVQGSDLDPLHDLERLYIASPDLQRASVVIAGQYLGDDDLPRKAVEKLAAARGVQATWRKHGGIPVAPWANADTTARVVALIAPHEFAITRPDDLPRVLAVARALAQRNAKTKTGASASDPGEALLGLDQDEMLAFSVEGARLFAQGNLEGTPIRLQLSVRARDNQELAVEIQGEFEDATAADKARRYWEQTRDRFASHPLLAFIGMREPLTNAKLETRDSTLKLDTTVSVQQARVLLGFIGNAVGPSPTDHDSRDRHPNREPALPRIHQAGPNPSPQSVSPPSP